MEDKRLMIKLIKATKLNKRNMGKTILTFEPFTADAVWKVPVQFSQRLAAFKSYHLYNKHFID